MIRIFIVTAALSLFSVAEGQDYPSDDVTRQIEDGRYGSVTSLLILHNGETLYESYFNNASAETHHDTRSVTKTITGMAVGLAIAEGLVRLDTEVAPFFADALPFLNSDPRKQQITVFDLLTMTSPMECNDWDPFSRGNEERMYTVDDWISFYWDLPIRADRPWETPTAERPYGRAFSYCTTGVQILSEAIARVTQTPMDDYLQERVFDPLGIEQPQWQRLAGRDAFGGGGLRLTTRDLGQLAELYRAGGTLNGHRILPASWIDASFTEYATIPDRDQTGYGFLWWRREYTAGNQSVVSWEMAGNGGNRVIVIPSLELVAVITKTDFNTAGMHDRTDELIETEIVGRLMSHN